MRVLLLFLLLTGVSLALPGEHLTPGKVVPAIEAPDQAGHMRSLQDLRGPNGLVLVVFRSADW